MYALKGCADTIVAEAISEQDRGPLTFARTNRLRAQMAARVPCSPNSAHYNLQETVFRVSV